MQRVTFAAGSRVAASCALHDHGSASVHMLHHNHHGISDAAGQVRLRGVPALSVGVDTRHGTHSAQQRVDVVAERERAVTLTLH